MARSKGGSSSDVAGVAACVVRCRWTCRELMQGEGVAMGVRTSSRSRGRGCTVTASENASVHGSCARRGYTAVTISGVSQCTCAMHSAASTTSTRLIQRIPLTMVIYANVGTTTMLLSRNNMVVVHT